MAADYRVTNHGSLVLFHPLTPTCTDWLADNVQSDAQWWHGALVVEPRYACNLAVGLDDAGLVREGA